MIRNYENENEDWFSTFTIHVSTILEYEFTSLEIHILNARFCQTVRALCLASYSRCTRRNGTTIEPFSDRTFQLSLRYCGAGLTLQEANLTTNDPILPLTRDWTSFAKSFHRCSAQWVSTACLRTHSLRMAASISDPRPPNITKRGTAFCTSNCPQPPLST